MTQAQPNAQHPEAVSVTAGLTPAHGAFGVIGQTPVDGGVGVERAWSWAGVSAPALDQAKHGDVLAGGGCVAMTKAGVPCRGRATASGRCMAHS